MLEEKLGNPGKRKRNRAEPKPEPASSLTPPAYLDAIAKREWRRVAPKLRGLGLFTDIDRDALAIYCQSVSDFISASKVLAKNGATFTTPQGYVAPRPEVGMKRAAAQLILKTCAEFGMSPSARARMIVDAKPDRRATLEELLA